MPYFQRNLLLFMLFLLPAVAEPGAGNVTTLINSLQQMTSRTVTLKSSKIEDLKSLIVDGPQIASTASALGSNFASLTRESSQNRDSFKEMHDYLKQMDESFKKAVEYSNREIKSQAPWDTYNTHVGVELNHYRTEVDFIFDPDRLSSPESFKSMCSSDAVSPLKIVGFIDEKFHQSCKRSSQEVKIHPDTNIVFQKVRAKLPWKLDDAEEARLRDEQLFFSKHHFQDGYNMTHTSLKMSKELDEQDNFRSVTDAISQLHLIAAQNNLRTVDAYSCYIEVFAHHYDYRRDIILDTANVLRLNLVELEQLAGLCAGFIYEGDDEETTKKRDDYVDKVTFKIESLWNFLFDTYVETLIEKYWLSTLHKLAETKFSDPFPLISTYNTSALELKKLLDGYGSSKYKHQVFATNKLDGDQAKVFYLHSCPTKTCRFFDLNNNHLVVITRFVPDDINEDEILASSKWIDDFAPKIVAALDDGEYYTDYLSLAVINIELKIGGLLTDSNYSTILVVRNWKWRDEEVQVNVGIGQDDSTTYNTTRQVYYFTSGSSGFAGIAEMFKFVFLI